MDNYDRPDEDVLQTSQTSRPSQSPRFSLRPWAVTVCLMFVAAILGGMIALALTGNRLDGNSVYEQVSPSVVSVESGQSRGSGVIYSSDGYVITCAHLVTNTGSLSVTLPDKRTLDAVLVGMDSEADLALLKVSSSTKLPAARFGNSDKVKIGDLAFCIGNPGGITYARSFSFGVISGLNRTTQEAGGQTRKNLIQTDAATSPGSSGGALVNIKGEVIGINAVKVTTAGHEGMSFATPSNKVKALADEWIRNYEAR